MILVDNSGVARQADLSTLEITISNGVLTTNQGYSAPVTSIKELTFGGSVSNKIESVVISGVTKEVSYVNNHIRVTPSALPVSIFNSAGQLIESHGSNVFYIPFKRAPGTYIVRYDQKSHVIKVQ
jgi:hypothetical protein